MNYVPGPFTLIEGIQKLRPGYLLECETVWYWRINTGSCLTARMTIGPCPDAEEALDGLLKQSMQGPFNLSDVPVGIWLSGGIDFFGASFITPRRPSTKRLNNLFNHIPRAELPTKHLISAKLAEKYQTEHQELDLNPTLDLPSAIEEPLIIRMNPSRMQGAVPVWFLSKTEPPNAVTVGAEAAKERDELFPAGMSTYSGQTILRVTPRLAAERGAALPACPLRYWAGVR